MCLFARKGTTKKLLQNPHQSPRVDLIFYLSPDQIWCSGLKLSTESMLLMTENCLLNVSQCSNQEKNIPIGCFSIFSTKFNPRGLSDPDTLREPASPASPA